MLTFYPTAIQSNVDNKSMPLHIGKAFPQTLRTSAIFTAYHNALDLCVSVDELKGHGSDGEFVRMAIKCAEVRTIHMTTTKTDALSH